MKNYKDLIVWQKAHKLVLMVYKATQSFPKEEQYNLISQLRRAATSAPTNIAEAVASLRKRISRNFCSTRKVQRRKSSIWPFFLMN